MPSSRRCPVLELNKYSEDQPRDEQGQFASTGVEPEDHAKKIISVYRASGQGRYVTIDFLVKETGLSKKEVESGIQLLMGPKGQANGWSVYTELPFGSEGRVLTPSGARIGRVKLLKTVNSEIEKLDSSGELTQDEIHAIINGIDLDKVSQKYAPQIADLWRDVIAAGGSEAYGQVLPEDNFDIRDLNTENFIRSRRLGEKIVRSLDDFSKELVNGIDNTTRTRLTGVFNKALAEKTGLQGIAENLQETFSDMTDWRAKMIARSETTFALNWGQVEGYAQGGVKAVMVVDGEEHDEECAAVDGLIISIELAREYPSAHPNCTRSFLAMPGEVDPEDLDDDEFLDAVEKIEQAILTKLEKGDSEGHPFRGNQYTVGGVEVKFKPAKIDGTFLDKPEEIFAQAEKEGTIAGFMYPDGKIKVTDGALHQEAIRDKIPFTDEALKQYAHERGVIRLRVGPLGMTIHDPGKLTDDQRSTFRRLYYKNPDKYLDIMEDSYVNTHGWDSVKIEKGDVEGHEFHGNQWTEGGGGERAVYNKESKTWKHESGKKLPKHLRDIRIPPAWKDVRYTNDPKSSLYVVGVDAKGRQQAVYSEKWTEQQAAAKFARINELDKEEGQISKEVERDIRFGRNKEEASALRLIIKTGVRPGGEGDTGAEKKAYGATTLEGKHVVGDSPDNVRLKFVGKKGVSLDIPVADRVVAKDLLARRNASGPGGRIFDTDSKKVLDYTHSQDHGGFKTKDFRTLLGTRTAQNEVARMPAPSDERSYRVSVKAVAKTVSAKLGNTPVVALQSYIHPSVFSKWRAVAHVSKVEKVLEEGIDQMIPEVHFGGVSGELVDWRSELADLGEFDDDKLLDVTSPDVVGMLGFDPRELFEDGE